MRRGTEGPRDIVHSTPPPPPSLRGCCSGRAPKRGLRAGSGHWDAAKHCGTRQRPLQPRRLQVEVALWGQQRPIFHCSPTPSPPPWPLGRGQLRFSLSAVVEPRRPADPVAVVCTPQGSLSLLGHGALGAALWRMLDLC